MLKNGMILGDTYQIVEKLVPEPVYTVMDYIPGIPLDKALVQYGGFSQKNVLRMLVLTNINIVH